MKGICSYLHWANYEKFKLRFEVPDLAERWCQALGDSKLYYNAYGLEELWKLGGYEFLNQILEFINILEGRIKGTNTHFKMQPFWSKYFKPHFHQNLKKNEKPRFPKFIHYSAHAETLGTFLEALGIRRITRVPPAGALFIEFLRRYPRG